MFQRLSPVCELDRTQERILFQADADRNLIRIGTKAQSDCKHMRLRLASLSQDRTPVSRR